MRFSLDTPLSAQDETDVYVIGVTTAQKAYGYNDY